MEAYSEILVIDLLRLMEGNLRLLVRVLEVKLQNFRDLIAVKLNLWVFLFHYLFQLKSSDRLSFSFSQDFSKSSHLLLLSLALCEFFFKPLIKKWSSVKSHVNMILNESKEVIIWHLPNVS